MFDTVIVSELRKKLAEARTKVRIGSRYYYYKTPSNFYTVTGISLLQGEGISNSDIEAYVIYKSDSPGLSGMIWTRPINEFIGKVEHQGKMIPRFILA